MPKEGRKEITRRQVNEFGMTEKQEALAWELANGATQKDAYTKVYNVKSTNSATIENMASVACRHPKVQERMKAMLSDIQSKMMRDAIGIRKHVFTRLLMESEDSESPPAARIRALELLGKIDIVGMFRDRVEQRIVDNRKPEEIEQELRDRLRDMMR